MAYDPSHLSEGLKKWASIEAGLIASTDVTKRMPADIKSGYKHILNVEQIGRKRLLLKDPATGKLITTGKKLGQTFKAEDIVRILLTQPELMKEISDLSNMMRGEPGKPSGFVMSTGRKFHFEGADKASRYHNVGRPIVLPKGQDHFIKRMLMGIGKTVKGEFVFHPEILAEIEAVDKAMRAGGITGAAGTGKQWTTEVLTRYSGDMKASTSEGLINQLLKFKDNLVRIIDPKTTIIPEGWAGTEKFLKQKPIEMGKLAELMKKQQTGTLALIDKVAKTQPELAVKLKELFLEKPMYEQVAVEGQPRTNLTRSALVEAIGEIEGEVSTGKQPTTKGLLLRQVVENFPETEPKPKYVRPSREEILAGVDRESKLIRKAPGESWKRGDLKKRMWIDIPGHKGQKTVASFKDEVHFLVDSQKKMGGKPTKAEASLATARLESGGHAAGWGATKYPLTELGPELGDTGKRLQGELKATEGQRLREWFKSRETPIKTTPLTVEGKHAGIAELERISQEGRNLGVQRSPMQPTRPLEVVPGLVDEAKLAEKAKAVAGKAKFNIPSSPWFSSIRKAPKSLLPLMILAGLVGTMGSNQGMRNAA